MVLQLSRVQQCLQLAWRLNPSFAPRQTGAGRRPITPHLRPKLAFRKSAIQLDLRPCAGKRVLKTPSGALDDAARWNMVIRNVADLVDTPRRSTPEMRTLNPEEAARLLLAAQADPLEAFYTVALTCGLRLGELQASAGRM